MLRLPSQRLTVVLASGSRDTLLIPIPIFISAPPHCYGKPKIADSGMRSALGAQRVFATAAHYVRTVSEIQRNEMINCNHAQNCTSTNTNQERELKIGGVIAIRKVIHHRPV